MTRVALVSLLLLAGCGPSKQQYYPPQARQSPAAAECDLMALQAEQSTQNPHSFLNLEAMAYGNKVKERCYQIKRMRGEL